MTSVTQDQYAVFSSHLLSCLIWTVLFATEVISSTFTDDYAYLDFSTGLTHTVIITCFHKYYFKFATSR